MRLNRIGPWFMVMAALHAWAASARITLVMDGRPRATIVIGQDAGDAVTDAADELQHYIRKITGAEIPIVTDTNAVTGSRILVGESRHTRALGLRNADFMRQEYLMRAAGGDLILMGRDEDAAAAEALPGRPAFMPRRYYQMTGSLYAVYSFLDRCCGVRWYLPGELGEVIPPRKTLRVGRLAIRRQPSVRVRSYTGWDHIPATLWTWLDREWPGPLAPRERLRWARQLKVGGEPFQCCHSFYGFYPRFGAHHPEWFAQGQTNIGHQLCLSNPEVFRQVVQDARDFFDNRLDDPRAAAAGDVFSVMPMDSRTWCECKACRPRYDPARRRGSMFNNGFASDYVWDFVARVAREIAQTHPDKRIACCAYADYAEPPERASIPDNVAVTICKFHWKHWDPRVLKSDRDIMAAWRSKLESGEQIYFWEYYIFPEYVNYRTFPSIAPRMIADDIRVMRAGGMRGGQLTEMTGPPPRRGLNLGIEHLRIYVTQKLLDDWDTDVEELLEEYFRLFYGPAAKTMEQFFTRMEQVYSIDNPRLKPLVEIDSEPRVAITIDLGSTRAIRGAAFRTAAYTRNGVQWPASIAILGSAKGKRFSDLGELVALSAAETGVAPDASNTYQTHTFRTSRLNGQARYVRLQVQAAGDYVFADEIEIFGDAASTNLARGRPYVVDKRPNYQLTADPDDATQLTDGRPTQGHFWSANTTVGWQGGAGLQNAFVWTVLCPPRELAEYGRLLETALAAVPANSIYARRVDFIRESVYEAVLKESSVLIHTVTPATCPYRRESVR